MSLSSKIIINSCNLVEATKENGFGEDQISFLSYVYRDLNLSPTEISERYFDKKVSYQNIVFWLKKFNIKIKRKVNSNVNDYSNITIDDVFLLCVDDNGPQLGIYDAANKLNCPEKVVLDRKKKYSKTKNRKRISKKYQNVIKPQKELKIKRKCRSCGCDPYPNYFFCPTCHDDTKLPSNNISEQICVDSHGIK